MSELRQHNVVLTSNDGSVRLRPMTEDDWDLLLRWNSDPEVLYYSDGGNTAPYSLKDVQNIYRTVSRNAFCFIIEFEGNPIGECWLQKMNLKRILELYPDLDCRRIDIMIGEKRYWCRGIGTESIRMLTRFGFLNENADMIFYCNVADYNIRSRKSAQKAGYKPLLGETDFALSRMEFLNSYTIGDVE